MDAADIPRERQVTGTAPVPTWSKANPKERWYYIGLGAGAVLALEVLAVFVWGVTLL